MKAIILTPTFFPRLTGNAVTAGRIAQELTEGGIECLVIDLSAVGEEEVVKTIRKFEPDLVHGFHAYKSGRIGLAVKDLIEIPMIMTLTGTDLYADLKTRETRAAVLRVLAKTDRLTVFNDSARRLLVREGIAPQKISVIHQSVFFPERKERDFRDELQIGRKTKVCLLMGGIRRIKNFGYAFPVNKKEATETGRRAKRFIAARFRRDREQVDYLRLYRETADQRPGRSSRSMNHPISHNGATAIGPGSGKSRSTS